MEPGIFSRQQQVMLEVDVGALVEQFAEFLKPSCIGIANTLETEGKLKRNDTSRRVPIAEIICLANNHSNN
jgi:hypothetical protein